MDLRSSRRGR